MKTPVVVGIIAIGVALCGASLWALRRGTASRSDGTALLARVEHLRDGSCFVGGSREHCYELELKVYPPAGTPFAARLDANVPDRHASRVQPGSHLWVVARGGNTNDIALAFDALNEPAPAAPDSR